MDIVETGMVIDNVSLELIECYSMCYSIVIASPSLAVL